ncbi:MAG: DNA polymerase III subunit alpha [Panacagrimonas sp.]
MAMFVHLRLHTEFSITDGLVRVDPPKRKGVQAATLTSQLAELGMGAAAITDRMNLYATVKFYKAAEAAGIKPIVGCDLWVSPSAGEQSAERLTLLTQNETGYRNLSKLISLAHTDGQTKGSPQLARQWLREHNAGLIAMSGRDGAAFVHARNQNGAGALASLRELARIFPDRLYLEVARCNRPGDEEWVQAARALGAHLELPLVASNDVRFLKREDFDAHEARVCIAQARMINDDKRPRDYTAEQYLKPAQEMAELFADLPEAVENTLHIARRCSVALSFGTYHLPDFPVPEGETADTYLRKAAFDGLARRDQQTPLQRPPDEYDKRLEEELAIIEKMGFAGYFLVVADFIAWAKSNGCPVGPGRGSGAGSLVAYGLGITDLDPLPHDLLFERFLNPERVSMPDFDVDFCMDNRDRVIDYVTQRYGRERVGQIITYSTMAARGVVRDVARIMGHGYGFGDRIAKLIPGAPGTNLVDAMEEVPELKAAFETEEDVRAVLDMSLILEGITRGVGVHAGGVVIAPQPLTDYAPLYCEPGGAGLRTQFDMKDLEDLGLVKFDFLGLKTLTIIQMAVDYIEQAHDRSIDVLQLPLDDPKTYSLYASGDTTAVFQMESPGMQRASRDLKPDNFEDIVALVSLYRPGPMEQIPEFCARKRGEITVEYLHPDMEPVLRPTYGIFVYQEQVMQVSQRLAGYSLGGADLLRRAMGKKKAEEMAKQRVVFLDGAQQRGIAQDSATAVFDLMEKFANYGFNKSHAAAYALVSYQTAWLKTHYPAPFMAAVMSCDMDHSDTIVTMWRECERMGLKLLPPDINRSDYRFTVTQDGAIAFGLGAVKGVGESVIQNIVSARQSGGEFRDLADFCCRIDLRKANKRVMEALVHAGSLDRIVPNRATALRNLPKALALAEAAARSADSGQNELFSLVASASGPAPLEMETVADLLLLERLDYERQTLGFYLSGHPIQAYAEIIEQACSGRLKHLIEQHARVPTVRADGKPVWSPRTRVLFGAWVEDLRFFKARVENGGGRASRASYKVSLDDQSERIACWIDLEQWAQVQDVLRPDRLVFVNAELGMSAAREDREPEPRLYNAQFFSVDQTMAEYAAALEIHWSGAPEAVSQLRALLQAWRDPNGARASVFLQHQGQTLCMELGASWRIRLDQTRHTQLQQMPGVDSVTVRYRQYCPPATKRRFERSVAGDIDDF